MRYSLRLYMTYQTAYSQRAMENLRMLCEGELRGQYRVEVIDVIAKPELTGDERILAAPTVVKLLPARMQRILASLQHREKVLLGMDLVVQERGSLGSAARS